MSDAGHRPKSIVGVMAALLVLALGLAGCSGSPHRSSAQAVQRAAVAPSSGPFTISYAYEQEFNSYNNNTAAQAAVANAVVLNQVLRGFWFSGPKGDLEPDTEFGSYQRISTSPLTVRYTFAPKAIWSDGNPIDCDDAVLAWAANSGRWPTGKRDPDTGAPLTAFSSISPGAWANASPPQCADGDRSFTVRFNSGYADWASLFGPGTILPAHIVEKESGVRDIIAAVKTNDPRTMIKVGDVYNSLWVFKPGQYKTDISPSAGPYQVSSWKAGQSITLKPNPHWWGTPPKATTLVIKFIPQDRQVAALRSGAVQVIDPAPSTELLAQLRQGGAPVKSAMYDSFVWEHLDFNFRSQFKSKALRQAFAKCVPRQQIVDNLIKPQNEDAQILESRFLMPFQAGYAAAAKAGGQAYDTVDIAGARRILKAAGKLGTTVRLAYQTPNPSRKAEVDLIRDFCGRAGFKVVDDGTDLFFGGALDRGDFDVAIFPWNSSPLITQNYPTYLTGNQQNKQHYSNPVVDQLLHQLYAELDPATQLALEIRIDTILWSDLATIPLFVFPGMLATSPNMQDVQYNPNVSGVTYNAQDWIR